MDNFIHLLVKYNLLLYNENPLIEHKKYCDANGFVYWGIIKPSKKTKTMSAIKHNLLKEQLKSNQDTYVFFACNGKVTGVSKLIDLITYEKIELNKKYFPKYYLNRLDKCPLALKISDMQFVENEIINVLYKVTDENIKLNLKNQTNPLYTILKGDVNNYLIK